MSQPGSAARAVTILHSVLLAAGLSVASLCEAPDARAPYAFLLLGIAHLFLFWRTRHRGTWIGSAIYASLTASWFLPVLPGVESAYPPTRFLVIAGSAAHLAGGSWDTTLRRPWAAGLFVTAWCGLLAWRAYNLVDALAYGYDLAHVQNMLVNTLQGRFLWSDYTSGSILSHHLFASLSLLAPVYAFAPHPFTLQLTQIVLMGASVGFVAAASSSRFGPATALPVLLVFLCHPAFAGQAVHEFDPGVLGLFGASLAIWGWGTRRPWALCAGTILALGAKEHFAGAAFLAGCVLAMKAEERRTGLLLMAAAVVTIVPFVLYAYTSDDPFSLRTQLAIRFNDAATPAFRMTASRLGYILHLLLPTGGLAILGLPALLPCLPEPTLNILSRFPMHSLTAHYHVISLPFLALATGAGIARLEGWRPSWSKAASRFAAASAILSALLSQIGPISQSLALYDIIWRPRPQYAEWEAFVKGLPEGDVAVKGGYRLLLLVPDRRPVVPLPYIDLSEEIAKRPLLILDSVPDSAPPGATLVASRKDVRVYRR